MAEKGPSIVEPGRNCRGVAVADHAAVLIDADAYFGRLHEALSQARESILIVGWDFDASISLRPRDESCPSLGAFLRALVEANEKLSIRILIWSVAVLHAPGAPLPLILGEEWQHHPRIALRLDNKHPLYACHHQKLVSVDGSLAFLGGIDLTVRRWDTCEHAAVDDARRGPDGAAYGPVHDMQMLVDGEAAREITRIAHKRWEAATGERLEEPEAPPSMWPRSLPPDFERTEVAISRTVPARAGQAGVREVEAMIVDALRAARHLVYIEAQYFTATLVRRVLSERLSQADCPEIIAVLTHESRGLMERVFMGNNRDRILRVLARADRWGKFAAYYPYVTGPDGRCNVHIHAKVLIVDDVLLRIGSANLNNRSMGLDTECDLSIEGATAREREAIGRVRTKLIAEHLGTAPEAVEERRVLSGSLIRTIEELSDETRGLQRFEIDANGPVKPVLGTRLLDPGEPFWLA